MVTLYVFSLSHPPWKKQLMNIEQVVETSAQLINGGRGKGLEQSARGTLVCRSPCKSHAELRWRLMKDFLPSLTEEPTHANLDFKFLSYLPAAKVANFPEYIYSVFVFL